MNIIMNIIKRQPDLPKTFWRDFPSGAGAAAAGRALQEAQSLSKSIFYLAARKPPLKSAPKKPRRGKALFHSHDLLFREIFSKARFAPDMLLLGLSRERFEFLDIKTLKPESPVLFTTDGRERRADLIFSISTKAIPRPEKPFRELSLRSSRESSRRSSRGPAGSRAGQKALSGAGLRRAPSRKALRRGARAERAEMLVICEHKSLPRDEHFLQFLDYLSSARRTWRTKGLMLPVLISTGRAWRGPLDFQGSLRGLVPKQLELFGAADVNFRPVVLNLRDIDLKKKGRGLKALPIWFIFQKVRNIGGRDVAEFFRLCQVVRARDRRFLAPRGLAYLMQHNPRWTKKALMEVERKTVKKREGRVMAMSCYQEVLYKAEQKGMKKGMQKGRLEGVKKGMKKGMQKGRLEGRLEGRQARDREVILSMLQKKMGISLISEVTGLPKAKIHRLKNGSLKNGELKSRAKASSQSRAKAGSQSRAKASFQNGKDK